MENELCRKIGQLLCVPNWELVGTELWVGSGDSNRDVSPNGCWRALKGGEISGIEGN